MATQSLSEPTAYRFPLGTATRSRMSIEDLSARVEAHGRCEAVALAES
jgi:hypothetical protein